MDLGNSLFFCPCFELYCVHLWYKLKKLEGSHQEATEKEVERILGYLRTYHRDDRECRVPVVVTAGPSHAFPDRAPLPPPQQRPPYHIMSSSLTPTLSPGQ